MRRLLAKNGLIPNIGERTVVMSDELMVPPILEDDERLSEFARTPEGEKLPVTFENYELLSVPEQRYLAKKLEDSVKFMEMVTKKQALEGHAKAASEMQRTHDAFSADLEACVMHMARGARMQFDKDTVEPDNMGRCSHSKTFKRAMKALDSYTKWKKEVLFAPKAPVQGKVEVNVQQNNDSGDYASMVKEQTKPKPSNTVDVEAEVWPDEATDERS